MKTNNKIRTKLLLIKHLLIVCCSLTIASQQFFLQVNNAFAEAGYIEDYNFNTGRSTESFTGQIEEMKKEAAERAKNAPVKAYQSQETIPGGFPTTDATEYIKQIIRFGFAALGILAMFMLMIGAYQYLMAAGNLAKTDGAKNTVGAALLGLALGLISFLLLRTINPQLVDIQLRSSSSYTGGGSGQAYPGGTPTSGAGKCVEGTGNCAIENFASFGDRARDASIICMAESSGVAGNRGDRCGEYYASIGVMQINLSCHEIGGVNCKGAFSCCKGSTCSSSNPCRVTNAEIYSQCVAIASNKDTNIQKALELFQREGFKPWPNTIKKCGISP